MKLTMNILTRLLLFLSLLLMAAKVFAAAEIESNDSAEQANALTSGTAMSGQLSNASDVDYFKITVGSAGTMQVSTSASMFLIFTEIDVLNSSQQVIASGDVFGDKTLSVGFNQAGTYYFRISQSQADTDPYSLTVTVSSTITAEIESNDTALSANALTSGVAINGQLYSGADVDYFKIVVGLSGTLQIGTTSDSNSQIEVLNSSQQVIASGAVFGDKTLSVGFNQAGSYFFKISQTFPNTAPYALTVTITGDPPSAPTISLQSKTHSSAVISIAPNGEGAAPITSYTTTCLAPKANRLSRATTEPQTYRLGEPTASGRSRINSNGTSVSIGRIYRPNPELPRAQKGDGLQFTLPDGRLLTAEVISSERTRYGNHLLKATQGADEILAVVNSDGDFVSSIRTAGNRFQSHIIDGETLVYSQSEGEFAPNPFDTDALLPPLPIDPSLVGSSAQNLLTAQNASGTVEISVGIQYDNATRDAYDEVAEAEFAIAYANQAYQNSGVDISFNIVGTRNYEGYVSSGNMAETLLYITFGTINPETYVFNENVKAWRDQVKADLVVQIVRYGVSGGGGTTCGVGWTPSTDDTFGSFYLPFFTHSVNALQTPGGYACGVHVVAHEMGHNFGLNHDRATSPDANPYYSYARGYKNASFGTVMSYTTNYAPYLSNPNKTYNGMAVGVPIGQSGEAHAAQAVTNKMQLHEAIYDNPSSPETDTWVKVSNTNQVEFTEFSPSTEVSCRTVATSVIGNSDVSNILTFTTDNPPSAPSRPTITRSGYGDGEIYLYVTANNGGSDITGYTATCTAGAGSFSGTSTSSPITVSGLTNDLAYTCTATATNSVGTSSASAATDPITPEELPAGLPIWLLYQATQ